MPPPTQDREQVQIDIGGQSYIIDAPKGMSNDDIIRKAIQADPDFASAARLHGGEPAEMAAGQQAMSSLGDRIRNQGNPHDSLTSRRLIAKYGQQGAADRARPLLNATRDFGLAGSLALPGAEAESIPGAAYALGRTALGGYLGAKGGEYAGRDVGRWGGKIVGDPKEGAEIGGDVGAFAGGLLGAGGLYKGGPRGSLVNRIADRALGPEDTGAAEEFKPFEPSSRQVRQYRMEGGTNREPVGPASGVARTPPRRMSLADEMAAKSAGGGGSPTTVARPSGRMVLTPGEAQSEQQMSKVAEQQARNRGMKFAGGMVPREGRTVPRVPTRVVEPEYPDQEDFRNLKQRMEEEESQ